MIKKKFDVNLMKTISLFENITRASVKDCIEQEGRIIFIVNQNEMAKAIGPKGANIRKLENLLKKKIKIVEYSEDVVEFVKNIVAPVKTGDVVLEDDVITITPADSMSRGLLIGRSAVNLRGFESIVKRHFPIKEIKVV